ncbi:hypothetical protein [Cupriavidus sp. IK-TO18]|uniref:hypothetical protein n=1 Tax=Cupriavidus sp. IK-TO18 TaxID=2782182 RepID=UPI0018985AD1|nr:hypothetical protein [Cupriavidus sp. IK-TO18]MBF6992283.1 hypothetical protein [Cupriavidus sp. IK-TO18]
MPSQDVIAILDHVSKYEPVQSAAKTKMELRAAALTKWLFAFAGLCILVAVILVLGTKFGWSSGWLWTALNLLVILTTLATLIGVMVDPVMLLVRVRRWKADASATAQSALAKDLHAVATLVSYTGESLQLARHWLTTRIGRIDTRISQFFGKETAFISQVGLVYAVVKEGGGVPWLGREITSGSNSFAGTFMLYACAGVLGLSLGAIWLRAIQGVHKHHLDLVELALKQQELSKKRRCRTTVDATAAATPNR